MDAANGLGSRHGPPTARAAGTSTRSLKTAATVLRALRLLGDHPDGMTPATLASRLDKSVATVRYMINTLCDAGYAECDGVGSNG